MKDQGRSAGEKPGEAARLRRQMAGLEASADEHEKAEEKLEIAAEVVEKLFSEG